MADMDNIYNQSDVVTGVEPAKKRKGAVVGCVTAGALAVIAGGGAIAYNVSDFVKNQVKLRISKPENYYSWINEKNSSEFASKISENYRQIIDEQKNGVTSNVSLKFDLSDDATSMIDEAMSGMDLSLNSIESVGINMNSLLKGTKGSGNVSASINGENLATIEMATDVSASEAFLRIAGLSDQWMNISSELNIEMDENTSISDLESIITPEELESLVTKYVDLYNSFMTDVEIEKKEEITIGDIKVEYTVAEVAINEEKADEISEGFLKAVKEDELIKSIVVDRTKSATADEFNEEIDNAISELKDNTSLDGTLTVKTYIDAKGNIRGFSADNSENAGDNVRFIMGKENSEIRAEIVANEASEEIFRTDISLTENDKTYNGTVNVDAGGEKIEFEIDNVTVTDEKKCLMDGKISLTVAGQTYSLDLKAGDNSQSVSSDIVIEGVNYGKLTVEISSESGAEVTLPDKSTAYDIMSDDFPTDYVSQEDATSFIKEILTKIGFDDTMAEEIAKESTNSIYNVYTIEDDFYFDDDFSNDDFSDDDFSNWDDEEFINENAEWSEFEDSDWNGLEEDGWTEWQSLDDLRS